MAAPCEVTGIGCHLDGDALWGEPNLRLKYVTRQLLPEQQLVDRLLRERDPTVEQLDYIQQGI